MKKNFVIIVLVLTVGILGYALFTLNQTQAPVTNTASSQMLDLSRKNLQQIDKNLLDNSSVRTLDVSNNNLTGALPAEIRKLTNLETLNASNNQLTGVPAEIGQLTRLTTINFANNNLSGLPLELGNLKNLKVLDLRGNKNISTYDLNQIRGKIPNAQMLTDS